MVATFAEALLSAVSVTVATYAGAALKGVFAFWSDEEAASLGAMGGRGPTRQPETCDLQMLLQIVKQRPLDRRASLKQKRARDKRGR